MYDTVVTVTGNVGSDVRQVLTPQGAALASFRLASTPRRQDRATGAWVDGPTTWYRVTTWRSLAENVSSSVVKGDPVLVHGRLRSTPWEKDGRSGESLDIDAITVGPDLSRGRTVFHRVARSGSTATPSPDGDPSRDAADTPDAADLPADAATHSAPHASGDPAIVGDGDDRGSGQTARGRSEVVGVAS